MEIIIYINGIAPLPKVKLYGYCLQTTTSVTVDGTFQATLKHFCCCNYQIRYFQKLRVVQAIFNSPNFYRKFVGRSFSVILPPMYSKNTDISKVHALIPCGKDRVVEGSYMALFYLLLLYKTHSKYQLLHFNCITLKADVCKHYHFLIIMARFMNKCPVLLFRL